MRVDLIAQTRVDDARIQAAVGAFERDPAATDSEHLIEVGGRLCYMSFHRPNPRTAKNADYIRHILEVGHGSVIEHATATFLIQGVSRSLTHELVRHRMLSYSQVSQRYVDESDTEFVPPPVIEGIPSLEEAFAKYTKLSQESYREFAEALKDAPADLSRKEIRQAARSVLPNATETKIVVTGNYRAWRHFIGMRATAAADLEIRMLAVEILRQLRGVAPSVFGDFQIIALSDGSEVATSTLEE